MKCKQSHSKHALFHVQTRDVMPRDIGNSSGQWVYNLSLTSFCGLTSRHVFDTPATYMLSLDYDSTQLRLMSLRTELVYMYVSTV